MVPKISFSGAEGQSCHDNLDRCPHDKTRHLAADGHLAWTIVPWPVFPNSFDKGFSADF